MYREHPHDTASKWKGLGPGLWVEAAAYRALKPKPARLDFNFFDQRLRSEIPDKFQVSWPNSEAVITFTKAKGPGVAVGFRCGQCGCSAVLRSRCGRRSRRPNLKRQQRIVKSLVFGQSAQPQGGPAGVSFTFGCGPAQMNTSCDLAVCIWSRPWKPKDKIS